MYSWGTNGCHFFKNTFRFISNLNGRYKERFIEKLRYLYNAQLLEAVNFTNHDYIISENLFSFDPDQDMNIIFHESIFFNTKI